MEAAILPEVSCLVQWAAYEYVFRLASGLDRGVWAKMTKIWAELSSRCQFMMTDCLQESILLKQPHPKMSMFLFFLASLGLAVIVNILPNIVSLISYTKQLSTTFSFSGHSNTGFSMVKRLQTAQTLDLCSRSFAMIDAFVPTAQNDVSMQSMTLSGKDETMKKEGSKLYLEALAAINLAKEMTSRGKTEKAAKLFEHAIALSPHHPDILTEYGEFLEDQRDDVISAEHLYCRALINSPSHTRALANRKRTQPLVEEIDQNYYNTIDHKRKLLLRIPENHAGIRRMMQESYYKHIYHTTAIEGNSFTLSQTRMLVENRLAIGGKSIIEHNEIIGMDAAFTFVNNSLLHRLGSLTLQDIKNIHKRVLGFVDPVGAGEFRTTQVVVGEYVPPDAKDVPQLMSEFTDWLNSEDALSLHPIELAALAHYKLVWIHPFYDGNGRTSRLLMNLILMQAGYPPIIIQVDEKHVYYDHLQTGNNGDIRPFIRFVARCTERAIDEYLLAGFENGHALVSQIQHSLQDDGRTIIIDSSANQNTP